MRRCRSCAGRIFPRAGFVTRSTIEATERGNKPAARDNSDIGTGGTRRGESQMISDATERVPSTPPQFSNPQPMNWLRLAQQDGRLRLYLPLGLRFGFARHKKQS